MILLRPKERHHARCNVNGIAVGLLLKRRARSPPRKITEGSPKRELNYSSVLRLRHPFIPQMILVRERGTKEAQLGKHWGAKLVNPEPWPGVPELVAQIRQANA
jgi:hypothetical protein